MHPDTLVAICIAFVGGIIAADWWHRTADQAQRLEELKTAIERARAAESEYQQARKRYFKQCFGATM